MFKKRNSWLMIGLVCLIFGGLTCLLYEPFNQWLTNSASLKEAGFSGALMLIFAVVLQIVIAFLPGEPLEIMAGVLYGSWLGLLLCLIGALIGSIIIYILVKKLGLPLVAKFFKEEQISQLHFLKNEQKLFSILFFIFLIPGVPKDLLTYMMPLTSLNLTQFFIITTVARIPSIITSTVGGDLVASQDYHLAIITFVLTAVLALLGMRYYQLQVKKAHLN